MIDNDDFFAMISGSGIDIAEASQSIEDAERALIRREILDEIGRHHLVSAIELDEDDIWTGKLSYLDQLQHGWYVCLSQEAGRNKRLRDTSDRVIEQEANEKAEADFEQFYGLQRDLVISIEDNIYAARHDTATMADCTDAKNRRLAQVLCKYRIVETDDLRVRPFIDLYDFMLPGELCDLDSSEFVQYLIEASDKIKHSADSES